MSQYNKHIRGFERALGTMNAAVEGMQREYDALKRQFRTYLTDHEAFARNVRKYLDELEADEHVEQHRTPDAANSNQVERRSVGEQATPPPGE